MVALRGLWPAYRRRGEIVGLNISLAQAPRGGGGLASLVVWVLTDARAGTASQALGVAEVLGLPFVVKPLRHTVLARLPNGILGATIHTLTMESRAELVSPWPDVVIAAGRRAAPVARWIKAGRRPAPLLVQVMFPGWRGLADFDLVAVPNHDRLVRRPANVVCITGAPHRVTPAQLAGAADCWRDKFAALPRPWVACLVGGASGRRPFTGELARGLAVRTAALADGGSVLLTTSRRTGPVAAAALRTAFADSGVPSFVHHWGDDGKNPYLGLLALADAVVVTGDSMSMCTEACAQPGPVFIFAPPSWVSAKHARLHAELFALGYARPLEADKAFPLWRHPPLNPAGTVAERIRTLLRRDQIFAFCRPLWLK